MKTTMAICISLAVLLAAAPSWAQSLTPIQGWVPLDSAKAKTLMHSSPVKTDAPVSHDAAAR